MSRLLPRSLAGQMALLIAVALFTAQAINFAIAVRDRAQFRLAQATRPAITRIVDALERERTSGRPIGPDRGRVRRVAADPIPPAFERRNEVAEELRGQLAEAGIPFARIDTGIRPMTAEENRGRRRPGTLLVIAIEQPGRGWLTVNAPWSRPDRRLLAALIVQTLILYAIILLPVIWIARRISKPLRSLARAARDFRPGDGVAPLEERGPSDVRAVIAAYNLLSLRVNGMLDEKDRMLGAIGHDLRTPLAALRVRIESVEDEDDRNRMADTIDEMNRTLDDILSLARLGRPSEPPTDVDLSALIDAVVEDFRDLDHQVEFEEAARLRMHLRPSLMRRAVRNLIENAVKYGGGAEVRLLPAERSVAIEVADRGPGIPPDKLAAVFAPFTRLETSRNRDTGGIGLGLALARAIVNDAGGDIALANRDGGGLTATITLPRV
ncbi:ATP-binding protein [Sphingomonas psychrotolerans]|uniref:histidine kinase n=1 Tax=Sphingomonas psychrotolerans TaxID=1327635 RepID=A0ABU3N1T5_9SPHN|nr:ATP-binding protein [Sphingomonas psychrotolerans]MDT8757824.1 ATP-binding protein [Sphingomonas psychrotolerans]